MNIDYRITKLRCLAIVVVVFGHSIILYDPQWGLYSTTYVVTSLMWIKRVINAFQMPLFLFLSGFCFFYSIKKYGYRTKKSIVYGILRKAKRLLVPFSVIAIFWMIPIRCVCNYASWDNLNLIQILKRVFWGLDSGHLWFLPTLFIIFIIAYITLPHIDSKKKDSGILFISFIGLFMSSKIPAIFFMSNVGSSLYWFCLGFEVAKYEKTIKDIGNIAIKYIVLVLSFIVIFLTAWWADGIICELLKEIAVSAFLLAVYNCVSPLKCGKVCELISKESMGIYLLHSPLIYFTYEFYANGFPTVVVFVNFVIAGLIAVLLTYFLMNGRWKWIIGY